MNQFAFFNKQLKQHYCLFYILWYSWVRDNCFNNVVTLKRGVIIATWPCCHGCHFITVWWNCFIFDGLLQKWLIFITVILVSLCFVNRKSYEHSLIIYIEHPSYLKMITVSDEDLRRIRFVSLYYKTKMSCTSAKPFKRLC